MSSIPLPDRARLLDMLDAAREAKSFVAAVTRDAIEDDRKTFLAI